MINRVLLTIIVVLTFYGHSISQRAPYTSAQITGLPMQYIPSFAGNMGRVRLATDHYIFNGNTNNTSNTISMDGFIPKLFTGIGFYTTYYTSDKKGEWQSQADYSCAGIAIAPKLSIKGKYTFSPSIAVEGRYSFIHHDSIFTSFYPGDPAWDYQEVIPERSITTYRLYEKIGFMFNSKKFYLGAAFVSRVEKLTDWHLTLQTGATFQKTDDSKFSFSPNVVWEILFYGQDNFLYSYSVRKGGYYFLPSNINLNFRYKKVLFGLARGFMAGFQNKNFRIMYTTNPDLSAHTLTLRLLFNNKDSQRTDY